MSGDKGLACALDMATWRILLVRAYGPYYIIEQQIMVKIMV